MTGLREQTFWVLKHENRAIIILLFYIICKLTRTYKLYK